MDSMLDETPISADADFMERIGNGLAQMERGESLTVEQVFGADQED